MPEAATFDKVGSSVFFNDYENYNYYLGLLNSKVFNLIVAVLNSTLNFQVKDIRNMPIKIGHVEEVQKLVEKAISIQFPDCLTRQSKPAYSFIDNMIWPLPLFGGTVDRRLRHLVAILLSLPFLSLIFTDF